MAIFDEATGHVRFAMVKERHTLTLAPTSALGWVAEEEGLEAAEPKQELDLQEKRARIAMYAPSLFHPPPDHC